MQTVQALKGASSQMRVAMKQNKELDLNFIDNLQVRKRGAAGVRMACMSCSCWQQAAGILGASMLQQPTVLCAATDCAVRSNRLC